MDIKKEFTVNTDFNNQITLILFFNIAFLIPKIFKVEEIFFHL